MVDIFDGAGRHLFTGTREAAAEFLNQPPTEREFFLEINRGNYKPHYLWVIIKEETSREGLMLQMLRWEGPGEYQMIEVKGASYLIKSEQFDHQRSYCPICVVPFNKYTMKVEGRGETARCPNCLRSFKSELDQPFKQM